MLLLARSGQRSAALAQFETCRRVLREQLGVEPARETTALYERIKRAASAPRHTLPAQVTPFVGREEELATLTHHLLDPACRLVTVVGQGGIGKTRLALEAAAQVTEAFLHGMRFVPLASVASPDFLVGALAEAVQLALAGPARPRDQLLNYLREQELLLVLDNWEHLMNGVSWLTDILRHAPDVKLLVTSRERLNLHGEVALSLEGLLFPEDEASRDLQGCSAVELFVTSARRVERDFVFDDAAKPHVIRVCKLVDGLPLGIELASTWVRLLDPRSIAREIEQSLGFLATTQPDVPERQHSLRAVFEYSWNLASGLEQSVLRKLAVFHGEFDREAAERVAGATLATLSALVDKSFLRKQSSGRYDLHQVMRQYAEEKLRNTPGEYEGARDRHCAHYAEFLFRRTKDARGAKKKESLDDVHAQIGNIRAAWQWAIAQRKWQEMDLALECLYLFYDIRSWFQEGRAVFGAATQALANASDMTDEASLVLARLMGRQAVLQYHDDEYAQAQVSAEASLAIAQRLVAPKEIALALNCLGNIAFSLGDYAGARQRFLDKLALEKEENDPWKIASTLNNLGNVANAQGDLAEAKRLFEESIALKRKIGDRRGLATSLNNLGLALSNQADYMASIRCRQEALTISREIGDKHGMARVLNNIGRVLCLQGEYSEAKSCLQESLAASQEIGNREMMMFAQLGLGVAACGLGDYSQSEGYCRAALRIARDIHTVPITLHALVVMATLAAKQGQGERALEWLALALDHPATTLEAKKDAEPLLAELVAALPPEVIIAAQTRGRARTVEQVVAEIMADDAPLNSGF